MKRLDPMQRNLFRSLEEPPHEVAEESHAQQRSLFDEEGDELYAQALERLLSATLTSFSTLELLSRLLEIFASIGHADAAIGLLREGSGLVRRVSIGMDLGDQDELPLPVEQVLEGRPLSAQLRGFTVSNPSRIARGRSFESAFCLPLVHAEGLVGVVYLCAFGLPSPVAEPEL